MKILRDAAAIEVGLDADRDVKRVRRVILVLHCEIFGKDILDAGGEFATKRDTAVPTVHRAVADDVILRRAKFDVSVFAGLDRDAIVAGVERHTVDEDVIAGLGVEPVVIGADAIGIDIADHDITASDGMMLPERRVDHLVALQQNASAGEEFDHRRWQLMADAEYPLGQRYLSLGQSRKI